MGISNGINNEEAIFSFLKLKNGNIIFNVNGEATNAKEATKELLFAAIQCAIKQGFVSQDVTTLDGLFRPFITDENENEKQIRPRINLHNK